MKSKLGILFFMKIGLDHRSGYSTFHAIMSIYRELNLIKNTIIGSCYYIKFCLAFLTSFSFADEMINHTKETGAAPELYREGVRNWLSSGLL